SGVRPQPASTTAAVSLRFWTLFQNGFGWFGRRSNRLEAGSNVIVSIRFVAEQRDASPLQVLPGHIAGIHEGLVAFGHASLGQLINRLIAIRITPRRYFVNH